MPGEVFCPDCRQIIGDGHTEVVCLRAQVVVLRRERDSWKEAWWDQRDATGKVAWEWQEPWMRPHLVAHLRQSAEENAGEQES